MEASKRPRLESNSTSDSGKDGVCPLALFEAICTVSHGAQTGRDRDQISLCLSQLEPGVPIHLHCPDPPRLTVYVYVAPSHIVVAFSIVKRGNMYILSSTMDRL